MDPWFAGSIDKIDLGMAGLMNGSMYRWMDKWIDGYIDGSINVWVDGWRDGSWRILQRGHGSNHGVSGQRRRRRRRRGEASERT